MTGSSDYVSEPSWEFYDLLKDPKEDHNAYNDKEYAEVIKKMKQEMQRLQQEVGEEQKKNWNPVDQGTSWSLIQNPIEGYS